MSKKPALPTYTLYWSPEGRPIATVCAADEKAAVKLAPMPYKKFLGEIYAELKAPK